MKIRIVLSVLLLTHFLVISPVQCQQTLSIDNEISKRSFEIDYDNNTFLMDGKPFQFIAGSFHYFRALPETWQRKLRTMRAAGLNAVTTYIEWSLHNPKDNQYVFTGMGDIEQFIKYAEQEGLYVILRPGPYICAERDMGGFPYWLLTKYPNIKLRTYDRNYIFEVTKWYQVLMSKMVKYMYGNGGPIIMVQVENEYGSFSTCDRTYQTWLRDETLKYTQGKAVLFTNDGPWMLKCGKIPNVLATMDFGASDNDKIDEYWNTYLRAVEPKGPLVNAEYYPGWLTHWQESMQRVPIDPILKSLEKQILDGANVNFYMFYGGTNFGFTAGANDGGPGSYNSDVTSYDYDAPMDESGQPTEKYYAIKNLISKYFPIPNIPLPDIIPKVKYGDVSMKPRAFMLDTLGRQHLSTYTVKSINTKTFEALNQNSGFVLYETILPKTTRDPASLKISGIKDRAYVYVDGQFVGVLSRENKIYSLPISLNSGSQLQILVENEGRINYGIANDFKGIVSSVYYDSLVLVNWTMTGFPLENHELMDALLAAMSKRSGNSKLTGMNNRSYLKSGPTIFTGEFEVKEDSFGDTYLDPTGWGKGLVFINGFNLGRYWPLAGPQITLYIPKEILKVGINEITMLELQIAPDNGKITLTDVPNLDGN